MYGNVMMKLLTLYNLIYANKNVRPWEGQMTQDNFTISSPF
jgi:hypothetical protein